MKLQINFDLLEKIALANKGFTLKKNIKKILYLTSFSATIATGLLLITNNNVSLLNQILIALATHTSYVGITSAIDSKLNKEKAIKHLQLLSIYLEAIKIQTSDILLVQSYKYHTDYEFDENNPLKINKKEYIMVPVYDNGEEKEISLLQEHVIGTKKYTLSCGEPNKVLKLANNPI